MADLATLAESFEWFAASVDLLGSPFYGEVLRILEADVRAGGVTGPLLVDISDQPIPDAVPIRLLGGAHRAVLQGELPALAEHVSTVGGDGDAAAARELLAVLASPPATILEALAHPPQTNEVGRSGSLVVAFLTVAGETGLPLRLLELGSSAGLNLRCDHYWYEQDGQGWGDP